MINISDKDNINNYLSKLDINAMPVFGKMSPQHMIEHLSLILIFSNGKKPMELLISEEKSHRFKAYLIDNDNVFPIGFKAPLIGDEPCPIKFENFEASKSVLFRELERFHNYFLENENATIMHPTLGPLDYREWIIFHNKHFTHHFKQFNLFK